jgi:hypothetical protein
MSVRVNGRQEMALLTFPAPDGPRIADTSPAIDVSQGTAPLTRRI